jgi:hypothetical protein
LDVHLSGQRGDKNWTLMPDNWEELRRQMGVLTLCGRVVPARSHGPSHCGCAGSDERRVQKYSGLSLLEGTESTFNPHPLIAMISSSNSFFNAIQLMSPGAAVIYFSSLLFRLTS